MWGSLNKVLNRTQFIFLIIGAGLIIGGFFLVRSTLIFTKTAIEAPAEITRLEKYIDSDGDTAYDVYVKYTVNGKEYEAELPYYSSGMYKGKKITILYDSGNPGKIKPASFFGLYFGAGIFFILGISFSYIGASPFIRIARYRKLKKYYQMVMADIISVVKGNVYQNNVQCRYVLCQWVDGGNRYEFKSRRLYMDAEAVIERLGLKQLPVYYGDYRMKKYYVDISVFFEEKQEPNKQ